MRHLLALPALLALPLAGCLTPLPAADTPVAATPALRPEAFFDGRTRGVGTLILRGRFAQIVRVESAGQAQPDGTFRLDQTIRYQSGKTTRRTWTMRRDGASGYRATLTNAAGPVTGHVDGNVFRLRYRFSRWGATMEQRMHLLPGDTVVQNIATVRLLGVPIAHLSERIARVDR